MSARRGGAAIVLGAMTLLGGCALLDRAPAEVKACEAYTKQMLSDPSSFARTSYSTDDAPLTKAAYIKRAGYGPRRTELMRLHYEMLDLDLRRGQAGGTDGALGVRTVMIGYSGGGVSPEIPPTGNVCEFRTIDGKVEDGDTLDRYVRKALENRTMLSAEALLGSKARAFHPETPCCLVP